jgi:hypothetical protein
MPGWLFWTFVGLTAWFVLSLVVALLLGNLFRRGGDARRRAVFLAGPVALRPRGRGLRKVS